MKESSYFLKLFYVSRLEINYCLYYQQQTASKFVGLSFFTSVHNLTQKEGEEEEKEESTF